MTLFNKNDISNNRFSVVKHWTHGNFISKVIVPTVDLKQDYEILGPVYFQVSNKDLFGSALGNYVKKYQAEIQEMKRSGTMSQDRADWGFLYREYSVGQSDFEKAFFIATEELKKAVKWLVLMQSFVCAKISTWTQTVLHSFIFRCMVLQ